MRDLRLKQDILSTNETFVDNMMVITDQKKQEVDRLNQEIKDKRKTLEDLSKK